MNVDEIHATEKRICETLAALETTLKENLACQERIKEQQVQIRESVERCERAKKAQVIVDGLCALAVIFALIITL